MNAATGFQRLGTLVAVRYGKPVTCAVTQRGFDQVAEPGGVDHDLVKARASQALQVVFDETPATHTQQRLRLAIRERPHAFAATRGEHHGPHLCDRRTRRRFRSGARAVLRAGRAALGFTRFGLRAGFNLCLGLTARAGLGRRAAVALRTTPGLRVALTVRAALDLRADLDLRPALALRVAVVLR